MMKFKKGQQIECLWRDGLFRPCKILDTRFCGDKEEYYIHYTDFDKRLEEWVPEERVREINRPITLSIPNLIQQDSNSDRSNLKKRRKEQMSSSRSTDHLSEYEIEKEHRVRNIDQIIFGKYSVDTWYFSPFPEPYHNLSKLYICEYCLKYMRKSSTLQNHKNECEFKHPPGNEIYRQNDLSIFELDGKITKRYCQSLCLLAKLFLDHKTLYFDVEPFLFYILTESDEEGCHILGYFSKEKQSITTEDYNLACILVFPFCQRRGFGKLLISVSYELSKREDRPGTPERPLSDMGKVSYQSYWTVTLIEKLLSSPEIPSIKELSNQTCIKTEDIIVTLRSLHLLKYCKGQFVIAATPKLLNQHYNALNCSSNNLPLFDPFLLHWSPCVTKLKN